MLDRMFLNNPASTTSYWIGRLSGASVDIGYGSAVDANGNIYFCGASNTTGSYVMFLSKYDKNGVIQWQRRLGGNAADQANGVAIDSGGNVYICGVIAGFAQLAKYNSSGTIQWQVRFGTTAVTFFNAITIDTSDNIYVVGRSTGGFAYIVKYNTSGTLQWQRSFQNSNGTGVDTDSSGNVYVSCRDAVSEQSPRILKYSSAGTLLWQNGQVNLGDGRKFSAAAVDSSGNLYVTGIAISAPDIDANTWTGVYVSKYDTSGTLLARRFLYDVPTAAGTEGLSICVDSSSNVYVCGYFGTDSISQKVLIIKYNSSLTVQWQRTLSTTTNRAIGYGISVDSEGTLYIAARMTFATTDMFFAKLPSSGALTGTYTLSGFSVSYTSASLNTLTVPVSAAVTKTSATSTLSVATTTATEAAGTLTSTVTTL